MSDAQKAIDLLRATLACNTVPAMRAGIEAALLELEPAPKALKTWNVTYCRMPTNYNDQQAALVEAETAEDAKTLVVRMLGEDRVALRNYVVGNPTEYNPAPIAGRIIKTNVV